MSKHKRHHYQLYVMMLWDETSSGMLATLPTSHRAGLFPLHKEVSLVEVFKRRDSPEQSSVS